MLVAVFLGAEVPCGVLRLAALRTDRSAARSHLHSPMTHRSQLLACAPETHDTCLLWFLIFRNQLASDQYDKVAIRVIAQAKFTRPEKGIYRWVDAHFLFIIIGGSVC